jgi:8-oxo-dGTP diphosphatase
MADRTIDLDVWRVEKWSGAPRGLEGQELKWVLPQDLLKEGLLSADAPVVEAIQLPSICAVTPGHVASDRGSFLRALKALATSATQPMICLRQSDLNSPDLISLARDAGEVLRDSGAPLMVNGDPFDLWRSLNSSSGDSATADSRGVAGVHVPARHMPGLREKPLPSAYWLGVSCHDAAELEAARGLGATYAFLGPVKETASHPGQPGMGWPRFEELVRDLPLPVYAIGGLGPEDLDTAWAPGAQGIAAIRSLWPKD